MHTVYIRSCGPSIYAEYQIPSLCTFSQRVIFLSLVYRELKKTCG